MLVWVGRIGLPIVAAVLTAGFLPGLMGTWPVPNLVLAGVVYLILANRLTDALAWAVAGGLVLDATLPTWAFYLPILIGCVGLGMLLKQRFGQELHMLVVVSFVVVTIGILIVGETMRTGTGWGSHLTTQALADVVGLAALALIARAFAGRKRRLAIEVQS